MHSVTVSSINLTTPSLNYPTYYSSLNSIFYTMPRLLMSDSQLKSDSQISLFSPLNVRGGLLHHRRLELLLPEGHRHKSIVCAWIIFSNMLCFPIIIVHLELEESYHSFLLAWGLWLATLNKRGDFFVWGKILLFFFWSKCEYNIYPKSHNINVINLSPCIWTWVGLHIFIYLSPVLSFCLRSAFKYILFEQQEKVCIFTNSWDSLPFSYLSLSLSLLRPPRLIVNLLHITLIL